MVTMNAFIVAVVAALSAFAGGAVASAESVREPYVIERAEVWRLPAETGDQYTIYVSRPAAAAPPGGYPVLYVLDGDDNFAVAAKTATRMARFSGGEIQEGVVVGIGYRDLAQRIYDYTPADVAAGDWRGMKTGGATGFRAFISDVLQPAIAAEFQVDRERQALIGHSFGGLFVLDTLLTEPALFNSYIAASASIWFGGEALFEKSERFAKERRDASARKLTLLVGELENGGDAASPTNSFRIPEESARLAERIDEAQSLTVRYRVLSGETHATTVLPAIAEAIKLAFTRAPQ